MRANGIEPPIGVDCLRKHFRDDLDEGFKHTTAYLRMRILRSAEHGTIRAASWLLDRLCPEFSPPRERVPAGAQQMTVIIHGAYPGEAPSRPDR